MLLFLENCIAEINLSATGSFFNSSFFIRLHFVYPRPESNRDPLLRRQLFYPFELQGQLINNTKKRGNLKIATIVNNKMFKIISLKEIKKVKIQILNKIKYLKNHKFQAIFQKIVTIQKHKQV